MQTILTDGDKLNYFIKTKITKSPLYLVKIVSN